MAETNAYFEAYRHILQSLTSIQPGEMSFEKYLVTCESGIAPPLYLMNNPIKDAFDLRPLVDDSIVIRDETKEPGRRVEENLDSTQTEFPEITKKADDSKHLNLQLWPESELLKLNRSQFKALQHALTKEFALI